ncbi:MULTISPECIES: hypothetical protein [unclassified Synechococcus]|uniref:hypothetical protein n=1 Tax=unclassified Synechococcus TaxID=2626047 RepID=UPI000AF63154|nr:MULTISPECIES: hypothetical protein [unclassified Synechococcus]MCT0246602.1 hypothetical protein [Synechococcus sp. CS-601]
MFEARDGSVNNFNSFEPSGLEATRQDCFFCILRQAPEDFGMVKSVVRHWLGRARINWRRADGSREGMVVVGVSLFTAGLTLITLLRQYSLYARVGSVHTTRLLNSAQAWIDHGFWNLGGFLLFQRDYGGEFPEQLYKSHVSLYALPHFIGLSLGGEAGFAAVVVAIPVITALVMALGLAVIAFYACLGQVSSGSDEGSSRSMAWVAGGVAFSVAFSSEPVWGLAWNNFDGSLAILLLVVSVAISVAKPACRSWQKVSTFFLLLSALSCGRFGILLAFVLSLVKLMAPPAPTVIAASLRRPFFRWPIIAGIFFLAASHYIRVWVYETWFGFSFFGSDALLRMGLTHWYKELGQQNIDYQTPLSAFTFLWRQSENAIGELPAWMNTYHFLVWVFAAAVFALVVASRSSYPARPFLEVFLLVPLCWSLLLNQSAAEHPDLVAILWLPVYVLGWSLFLAGLFRFVCHRWRRTAALWCVGSILYLLFLWQVQYFLRAYPKFH